MLQLPPYALYPFLDKGNVYLKQIQPADYENITPITCYDGVFAKAINETATILERIHDDYLQRNSIHWGIYDVHTDTIVGTCGYYRGFQDSTGEVGCVLLPEHQGKGYMTQALGAAVDFGFDFMGLQRIIAYTTASNHKAIAMITRLGFQFVSALDNEEEVLYEVRK